MKRDLQITKLLLKTKENIEWLQIEKERISNTEIKTFDNNGVLKSALFYNSIDDCPTQYCSRAEQVMNEMRGGIQ